MLYRGVITFVEDCMLTRALLLEGQMQALALSPFQVIPSLP